MSTRAVLGALVGTALGLASGLAAPGQLSAQDRLVASGTGDACVRPLRVSGLVLTEAGVPRSDASVSLPGLQRRVVTNAAGRVDLGPVCPGRYRVLASFLGYGTEDAVHDLRADTTLRLTLRLEAVALEGMRVEVQPVLLRLEERRTAHAGPSAFFDWRDFRGAALPADIPRWVVRLAGATLVACGDAYWGTANCFVDRRRIRPVETCVDESESVSRAAALARLPREDIGRAEFYRREGVLKLYTKEFLARAAMSPWLVGPAAAEC